MPAASKIFGVFVSSTFDDLMAERNALQQWVFPRLSELCAAYGYRFQPIDLRWGVSDEAGLDQQAMDICLSELGRCKSYHPQPNFIVLLGDRYGWRPLPSRIDESEFNDLKALITDPDDLALLVYNNEMPEYQQAQEPVHEQKLQNHGPTRGSHDDTPVIPTKLQLGSIVTSLGTNHLIGTPLPWSTDLYPV